VTDSTTPDPSFAEDALPLPGESDYTLDAVGYSADIEARLGGMREDGFEPGRVVRVDRGLPLIATVGGAVRAEPAAHLVKARDRGQSRAVVGDWVALARPEGHDVAIIEAILPRTSAFARKDPGAEAGRQVLISNVDLVFVVQSLSGRGVRLRRLERELVMAWESGATPVVILTKADLRPDAADAADEVRAIASGVDVIVESAFSGLGVEDVRRRIGPGKTAVFLGESGVGKSTLINRLVGHDVQATAEVRPTDDKGRHTTVAREMVLLPGGGVVIDTPGMRGLALWDAEQGMADAFADIDALAAECRFRDCGHRSEPGCAVVAAVESGELPAARLASYRTLSAELVDLARKQDAQAWRSGEKDERGGGTRRVPTR